MAAEPGLRVIPTDADLVAARDLRHALHRAPELSGAEAETAARIVSEMTQLGADRIETGIGGHGVMAVLTVRGPGYPRVPPSVRPR